MNNSIFRVLSSRPFLFLWIAELFSQFAFNMMSFILIVVAYSISNSSIAVSGIVLSFTVPAIIFGLIAGVYVDRWNKKTVLFSVNIIRAFLLLLLSLFHANLALILLLSFFISMATQFFIPAESPMIPLVVKKNLLLPANALFGLGVYGSILVAYAFSGPFLILLGTRNTFFILSLLLFAASVFIFLIQDNPSGRSDYPSLSKTVKFEIGQLFKVIARTKEIYRSLFLLTLLQTTILIVAVVVPGYVKQVLDIPINRFPILFITPAALGMLAGSLILSNFFHLAGRQKIATVGLFLAGITFLLFPYGTKNILHVMVFLSFILGVSNALIFIPSNTFLQEKTPEEFRGKVYGALNSLTGLFSILPIILVGWLSDVFGASRVIEGIGIAILLVGVWRLLT
ncbi:MFS transporter [Patescibacteria group bacterium]|nr:MFS transporter [Patescibacteria group bacterium]MCL5010355.1 MFS transporter [Patescibacteria group bacterium]